MDRIPRRKVGFSDPEVSQADRELDEVASISLKVTAVILVGFLIGAGVGGLEWTWPDFIPFSILVLVTAATGLSWAVVRLINNERSRAVWILLFLLILAILTGYQVAQYQLFLVQVGQEITERSAQEMKQIFPVELPPMIREILVRRTGMSGIAGYHLLRLRRDGPGYLLLWVVRFGVTAAAALAIYHGLTKPGLDAS